MVVELTEDNVKNKDDVQLRKAIEVLDSMIKEQAVAIK